MLLTAGNLTKQAKGTRKQTKLILTLLATSADPKTMHWLRASGVRVGRYGVYGIFSGVRFVPFAWSLD